MVRLEPKTPSEVRNYEFDWSTFLGADTIATSDVTVDGVTLDSETNDDTSVTIRVSGGADETIATITNTITTAGGLTESETYTLKIAALGEPVTLEQAKEYLRVLHNDEDSKIAAMIPRARLWVEDHTGLALVRREFVERHAVRWGAINLYRRPLTSVASVEYLDADGATQTYVPRAYPPSPRLVANADEAWPGLQPDEAFEVTYTAGYGPGEADDRLIGAMLALIEGEYAEGYAYPERAVEAAERCCHYLRAMIA